MTSWASARLTRASIAGPANAVKRGTCTAPKRHSATNTTGSWQDFDISTPTREPRVTPISRSAVASRFDRSASSPKVSLTTLRSPSTVRKAVASAGHRSQSASATLTSGDEWSARSCSTSSTSAGTLLHRATLARGSLSATASAIPSLMRCPLHFLVRVGSSTTTQTSLIRVACPVHPPKRGSGRQRPSEEGQVVRAPYRLIV